MGGGRRKFRHCRLGSTLDDAEYLLGFTQGVVPTKEYTLKSLKRNIADQQLELCVARTQVVKRVFEETVDGDFLSGEELSRNDVVMADPLLPRCRYNPSHTVSLRNLKKHEVSVDVLFWPSC